MGRPPDSQAAPLPSNLPFRLVSKTIGSGAYASIRKAVPLKQAFPVIAVKFINKEHAFKTGRLRPHQIDLELGLHRTVSGHANVIRFLNTGEDEYWKWLAMELAEGGDLFDKIEADEGVNEDIAHLYFTQLVSAVMWCHSKGVAHRDIKPENILLSKQGDLKLADFGLATQFQLMTGQRKQSSMVCGSPPYIAPEILAVGHANSRRQPDQEKREYNPEMVDVWSCAIVLFVLCAGNTPWDTPDVKASWEFHEYVKTNGHPDDELWQKMPIKSLDLLRGMLSIDPAQRWTFEHVRKHFWYQRSNPHMANGKTIDGGVGVATHLLQGLRIDFDKKITASQAAEAMDVDQDDQSLDTGVANLSTDWEDRPPPSMPGASLLDRLAEDPSMSQFSATPSVPLSLTQVARGFSDILSTHSMTRFLSTMPLRELLTALNHAFQQLSIPMTPVTRLDLPLLIPISTLDVRKQELKGNIRISAYQGGLLDVTFNKAKGDPVGWRRLFKDVATICKDAVVRPP